MELDQLKKDWQQSHTTKSTNNHNIMELIKNESNSPVAALKRSYRKQMVAMILLPIAIALTNITHIDKTLSSVLFWCYVMFCATTVVFARQGYNTAKNMERMDGTVKSSLEQQISVLEASVRQNLVRLRMTMLFFILLIEVLPYFQHFSMLDKWHSLSPFIRFGAYAALLLLQYLVTPRLSQRKFGRHIEHLKELVAQMQ